jgi:acyl carrier protein
MTEAEVYAELTGLFRQVFRNPAIELSAASTPETIAGWDSFKYVEIIVTLESMHDIEIDALELDEMESVGDLVRVVVQRTSPPAG